MTDCRHCTAPSCVRGLNRRRFLAGAGAALAAAKLAMLESASPVFAQEPRPAGRPRIDVVFVRPSKTPVVSWPGGNCDVPAQQALFARTLAASAARLDVDLRMQDKPIDTVEQVNGMLDELAQSPPDGLLIVAMELTHWPQVTRIVEKRGDIPTVVYSNMSAFTDHLQCGRKTPRTFVGATQDVGWLDYALRMLAAVWRMKHTRILLVHPKADKEVITPHWGTVFHPIPRSRFEEEFKKVAAGDEVRAMADAYAKAAARIIEPSPQDLLEAARNYIVCRKLMQAEQCQGITIDCLGWKNPVCMAFSRLMDEGVVAGCEADLPAAVAQLLVVLLFDRPGFIQDPSPNTVNNTLLGAHCTSPTRLKGFHDPYRAPFVLRNYHTQTGVSPQVLWPEGDEVSVLDFADRDWKTLVVGTGRVVANVAQPPSGCCRTAVEMTINGAVDTRDTRGFHQLFVWGNLERPLKAFGRLAGIEVKAIC